jgi:hypothetical protein
VCNIIHPNAEPLSVNANDAGATRSDHLNLGPVIEPYLAQAMHELAVSQDLTDLSLLSGPQLRKRDDPALMHNGNSLPGYVHVVLDQSR